MAAEPRERTLVKGRSRQKMEGECIWLGSCGPGPQIFSFDILLAREKLADAGDGGEDVR